MIVTLWGVRGSIATSSLETSFYGGSTACIEAQTDSGVLVFFDAGTGLREAGEELPDSGECHLFISHGHSDHIMGLMFFKPIHSPKWTTHIYLPEWLENLTDYFYECSFFPIPFDDLEGNIIRHIVKPGDEIAIGDNSAVKVKCMEVNHPGGGRAYRMLADGASFVYSGDHEIEDNEVALQTARALIKDADIAVVDATYSKDDYKPGWGHSNWDSWLKAAEGAGVKNLILSHHDPERFDHELDLLSEHLYEEYKDTPLSVYVAREGMRITANGPLSYTRLTSDWLLLFLEALVKYKDEHTILDLILAKARSITNADAGTIFLVEGDNLVFAYTHNDSLFSVDSAHRHAYAAIRMPISKESIAGYVAVTGNYLNIADVRQLEEDVPYFFNESFDNQTGYRTCSMLTVPFLGSGGEVMGVMQLINSMDMYEGKPCPFTDLMVQNTRILARETASILERSAEERKGVYGILRMAAVHDPSETGPHAERVGSIAAELYHCWAEKEGHTLDDIRYYKGRIRLAAMLHDIGKVGISDLVLKKPDKLTDEEFAIMKEHTIKGASILADDTGDFALIAHDIALHHHQKWNGFGYPGGANENRLKGEEIPLAARITAIADVFDALVSPRCYKKPWTFEKALNLLQEEAGEHFDPYLIELLMGMVGMLPMIYEKFPDHQLLDLDNEMSEGK